MQILNPQQEDRAKYFITDILLTLNSCPTKLLQKITSLDRLHWFTIFETIKNRTYSFLTSWQYSLTILKDFLFDVNGINQTTLLDHFKEVSNFLESLYNHYYKPGLFSSVMNPNFYSISSLKVKPNMLAKYIWWFINSTGQVFDDNNLDPQLKADISETLFGEVMYDLKLTTSFSKKNRVPRASSSNSNSAQANSMTNQASNTGVVSDYKARGPLSSEATGLIGTPGQPTIMTSKIYCILGVDQNGNAVEDSLYVRPVEPTAALKAQYTKNNENIVLFGKAKGNGYCTCFFDNLTEANTFLQNFDTKLIPASKNIASLQVFTKFANNKGFYKVATNCGPCYISAKKLNEELIEELNNEEKPQKINIPWLDFKEDLLKDRN